MTHGHVVYRIQNKWGQGPYQGTGESWQTSSHDFNPKRATPSPEKSFGREEWYSAQSTAGYRVAFGFTSMVQLKRWFNLTERKRLARRGFKVWRMKVPRLVLCSYDQCCFLPKVAK